MFKFLGVYLSFPSYGTLIFISPYTDFKNWAFVLMFCIALIVAIFGTFLYIGADYLNKKFEL